MILEEYVEFETAKLLKEKGFNEMTDYWYDGETGEAHRRGNYSSSSMAHYDKDRDCNAPTQALAMRWLREEKRWIVVIIPTWFTSEGCISWSFTIWGDDNLEVDGEDPNARTNYNSYEEACEEAIKYCLYHTL